MYFDYVSIGLVKNICRILSGNKLYRWWFQIVFIFTPNFGEDFPFWVIFFRWGWNHQLEKSLNVGLFFFSFHSYTCLVKNDQPEDLDLLTLQLKLGWKMKGTGVMGHYPIFWGRESNHANGILTEFLPDTRWFFSRDLFYPLNWRSPRTPERVRFSPSQKGHQQNCQEWIVWVGFVSMTPDESDPKWIRSWESFFIFDRWLTRRMANWQNFTFQNCLTHENFIALRIIGPSKLAILRSLTLRHTGSNTSIGGSKIPRVILFGDLWQKENLAHKWYPNCRPGSRYCQFDSVLFLVCLNRKGKFSKNVLDSSGLQNFHQKICISTKHKSQELPRMI